jgi:glycosyltransferase involved in cell wall biosynthesis
MTTIAFIVNGDLQSAMGERANAFAEHLRDRYDIRIDYRTTHKILSILRFLQFLISVKPDLIYVFDMSYSGVIASSLYKLANGACIIVDTGDAISELAQSMGRGTFGLWLTRLLEKISLSISHCIVVRGTFHQELLSRRGIQAELIRDGVDTNIFKPINLEDLRKQHGLDQVLTVGVLGTVIWNEKQQMCYGWDLVEVIRLLKDAPVKGILIGEGSGIPRLQALCKEYGIEGRLKFLGRIPYDNLPTYLNLIDVCLSTQTNDVVGNVRTTGKLPLYMATGRYILASKVGEAVRVLKEDMLVDYAGVKDEQYPQRLAERIAKLLERPVQIKHNQENVIRAKTLFDYSVLAEQLADLFDRTIQANIKVKKPAVSNIEVN